MALRKKVKAEHMNMLFRQMALLTASGLTSEEALKTLAEDRDDTPLGRLVSTMQDDIQRGVPAGEVIARNLPQLRGLPPSLLKKGGEEAAAVFREAAAFSEKKQEMRRILIASMIYPSVIAFVLVIVVALLMIVVVPMLASMFAEMGSALPIPTRIVIAASDFLDGWGGLFVLAAFAAIISAALKKRVQAFGVADKMPLIGNMGRSVAAAEFLMTLTVIQKAGLPLSEALPAAASSVTNPYYARRMEAEIGAVKGVSNLIPALRETGLFPPVIAKTLQAGERAGAVSAATADLADFMEREAEKAYARFSSLMPPVMMFVLGAIVGFCIIAMYMPIFQMGAVVSK